MSERKYLRLEPAPAAANKPVEVDAKESKTVRITVDLSSFKGKCPIVSYKELLQKELKAMNGQNRNGNGHQMDDDGDEEEVKKMALKLEEKYGMPKKNKYQSYTELGAGYDESDSFIDNTDALDEGLPDDVDTKKGGFYVNYGKLEFTKIFDQNN